ncbi:MAG: hypothetical protein IRY94_04875 [Rhodospirillaceae bacterium]|nr:hypothetical protein [Rhodospirillaceae bacterium]
MLIRFGDGHIDTNTIRRYCDRAAASCAAGQIPREQVIALVAEVRRLCAAAEEQAHDLAMVRHLLEQARECLAGMPDEEARLLAHSMARCLGAPAWPGPHSPPS